MAAGDADAATEDGPVFWDEDASAVSRARGRAFEMVCLAATAFGLVAVLILLLLVAVDAFQPFTADAGWHLTYLTTVVAPLAVLGVVFYRSDEPAGEVAYVTTGLPVVGLLLAGGFVVIFNELLAVRGWFALVVAVTVSAGVVSVHGRLRPGAPLERTIAGVVTVVLAVFGLPPSEVVALVEAVGDATGSGLSIPVRYISLREAVLELPVIPADWIMLVVSLTLPAAAAAGLFVGRRRESRRDGAVFAGGILAVATAGVVAGPALGIGPGGWVVVATFVSAPVGAYVEGVVRRREGTAGLLFPLVGVGGVAAGTVAVGALGFAGPDAWLDWGFLTSAHSRTAADAGIYPVMVGSVMMMVVIVLTTFPVGVGAAIYLEEYAPSSGWSGRFVTLVEINIGNLAGVPSVVYGLLALALFIRSLEWPQGSVIVGGLAVGLLILPIVIISAQEAIRAVPDSHREASYGMGATRWQTVRQVVLPEATPGILTGTILALGRAIGETAPLLMIGMASSVRLAPNGFFDSSGAMPRQIFSWSTELDPAFRHGVLAAGVVTLVAVLLVMNGTAIVIRNKYQREH